jgi:hypothetical protein
MVTILKFTASYASALASTMLVLGLVGFFVFGGEILGASFGEYLALLIVTALLALVPAILFVWIDSRTHARLSALRFGAYGLIIAFAESCLVMWLAFNGNLAAGWGYIIAFSVAGLVGGVTISKVWNGLTSAIPARNH